MSRPLAVRMVSVLILCAVLVAPAAFAAGARVEAEPGPAWLEWLLSTFSSLLRENGCMPDPYGGCGAATSGDNGCSADPYGGCAEATDTDNGCHADPNGGCSQ